MKKEVSLCFTVCKKESIERLSDSQHQDFREIGAFINYRKWYIKQHQNFSADTNHDDFESYLNQI